MCIRDRLERPTPTSEWYLRAPCVQERPTGTVREADRRVCRWVPPPGDYRLRHPGASAEGRSEPVSHRPTSGDCDRLSGGRWPPEPFVLARETRRAYARRMSGEPAEGRSAAATARRLVETLGGRYSAQLGIAVDQGRGIGAPGSRGRDRTIHPARPEPCHSRAVSYTHLTLPTI